MGTVSYELQAKGVSGVLAEMAERGLITELRCAMEDCYCPGGRGYFDPRTTSPDRWTPNPDHFPLTRAKGGHLVPENIRLAHKFCNRLHAGEGAGYEKQRDKGKAELEAELATWLKADPPMRRSAAEAEWVKIREALGFGGYEPRAH